MYVAVGNQLRRSPFGWFLCRLIRNLFFIYCGIITRFDKAAQTVAAVIASSRRWNWPDLRLVGNFTEQSTGGLLWSPSSSPRGLQWHGDSMVQCAVSCNFKFQIFSLLYNLLKLHRVWTSSTSLLVPFCFDDAAMLQTKLDNISIRLIALKSELKWTHLWNA